MGGEMDAPMFLTPIIIPLETDSQVHNIIEFANNEIDDLVEKLNSEYDIVYYQSLPANSNFRLEMLSFQEF